MKIGTNVRLVSDHVGDLPKRYMGRKGKVVKRRKDQDEIGVGPRVIKAYGVKFKDRESPLLVYEDEIVKI